MGKNSNMYFGFLNWIVLPQVSLSYGISHLTVTDMLHVSHSTVKTFFFRILFIYSWERERDRDTERQRHRQREKQASCREPNVGLYPRTPGSRPGLKAGTKLGSRPGIPVEWKVKETNKTSLCHREKQTRIKISANYLTFPQLSSIRVSLLVFPIFRLQFSNNFPVIFTVTQKIKIAPTVFRHSNL